MNKSKQHGATLIVALVLLVIVTLFGIAGMRGTTLEMKMVASARDRAMAFEAAESTLRRVEDDLIADPPTAAEIKAYGSDCAASEETKGYCFAGDFELDNPYETCKIFPDGATDATPVWSIKENWEDTGNYATETLPVAEVDGADNKTVTTKYFVEFMCYTLREAGLQATLDDRENDGGNLIYMPLFRVTALAEGLGQRARVISQSMVKLDVE